jgi:DNA polymerase IIIc chi subunit
MFYQEMWSRSAGDQQAFPRAPRVTINSNYNRRPKSAPRNVRNRSKTNNNTESIEQPKSTSKQTSSPRSNKQKTFNKQMLFDPFNNFVAPPERPSSTTPRHPLSPRRYAMKSPRKPRDPIYIEGNQTSPQDNDWKRPSVSKHYTTKKIRTKHSKQHTIFTDLSLLPQYQHAGLRRITLLPPTYDERKNCYISFNQQDNTWHTVLFPPKLPLGRKDAGSLEHWLNVACAEYFNLQLKRSVVEAVTDIRHFHLSALFELANQIETKSKNHARVIRNICHRLQKLDATDLQTDPASFTPKDQQATEQPLDPACKITKPDNNNNNNNNEIILKQADIIKDCQERLRFERSLRLQAEARLKLAVEKGRITVNIN